MLVVTKKWEKKINSLSVRERLIIFSSIVLVLFCLFEIFLFNSLRQNFRSLEKETQRITTDIQTKSMEIEMIKASFLDASSEAALIEIDKLNNEIRSREAALLEFVQSVTPPEDLVPLLYSILAPAGHLSLVEVNVDKPFPLLEIGRDGSASMDGEDATGQILTTYKQEMQLRLKGSYFAVRDYLQLIEESNWALFWKRLDYRVENWPVAEVTLQIYTITSGFGVYGE